MGKAVSATRYESGRHLSGVLLPDDQGLSSRLSVRTLCRRHRGRRRSVVHKANCVWGAQLSTQGHCDLLGRPRTHCGGRHFDWDSSTVTDTEGAWSAEMQLVLASPFAGDNAPTPAARASITLRRLQQFSASPFEPLPWTLTNASSGAPVSLPIAGITLLCDPGQIVASAILGADSSSYYFLMTGIPPVPALTGTSVYCQTLWIDPCGLAGLSSSDGLRVTIVP